MFGKDWAKVADHVSTRSRESVYVNAYYLKKKLTQNPSAADPELLKVF